MAGLYASNPPRRPLPRTGGLELERVWLGESFVFGRGKVEEFFFVEIFFFHRNDCVGFVVFLKKPTGTR